MPDEAIIRAIVKDGKSDVYGILYDRYSNKVYRKCISFVKDETVAQDMVQDIFLKVFFQLPKFKGNSRFSTWLYAITYNFCVEHYRKNSKIKQVEIGDHHDQVDDESEDLEILEYRVDQLKQALDKIDPHEKKLLLMKYQDDISIKEIMNELEISESAVKMRLSRARQRVKSVVKELEMEGV